MKFIARLRVWRNWGIVENVLKVFLKPRGSANRRVDLFLPLIASISGRLNGAWVRRRVVSGAGGEWRAVGAPRGDLSCGQPNGGVWRPAPNGGVVARKQLKDYFLIPHARPVPVKVGLVQAGSGTGLLTPPFGRPEVSR